MGPSIRVIYELDVRPGMEAHLHEAWREIVAAHVPDGALESVLSRASDGPPGRFVAISRWRSLGHWELGRRDDAAPRAYARFEEACEVVGRRVLEEVETLRGPGVLGGDD